MRNNHTRFAIILDRSGSMGIIEKSTVEAFNEFINGQKSGEGTADVTLVRFDSKVDIDYTLPLNAVPTLDSLRVRGNTALYDAIGTTIQTIGEELSNLQESDRPSKVIVAVFTDGHENASREYKQKQVADLIKEQTNKYNWTFSFFGANQDAVLTAKGFGIDQQDAYSFNSTAGSVKNVMKYAGATYKMARSGHNVGASFAASMRSASLSNFEIDDATLNAQVQANINSDGK